MTHYSFDMLTVVVCHVDRGVDLALDHVDSSIHQIDCDVITSEMSFFSHVTEHIGDTEAVNRMFVPQTVSSLGCPQVLRTMAPSELLKVNGRVVYVLTVRSWNDVETG